MVVALRLMSAAALAATGAYAVRIARSPDLLRRQSEAQVKFWHRRRDTDFETRVDDAIEVNGPLGLVVGGLCLLGGAALVVSTLLGAR